MAEQIFFEGQDIKVTNARFIVSGETYAMSGIISVKIGTVPSEEGKKARTPYSIKEKLSVILSSLVFLGGCSAVSFSIRNSLWTFVGVCSLILLFVGIQRTLTDKGEPGDPPTHTVILRTSSGEVKALEDKDRHFIARVTQALNDAIVARG